MLKKFRKQMKNEKGLTLIELLAVIVILAIIAAIAVPAIGNIINNSKDKAILAEASNIISGAKLAVIDNECGVVDEDDESVTCNNDALKKHVDGIKLDADDEVERDKDGNWHVTYSRLSDVKNSKYKSGITDDKISEEQLNTNLNN